MPFTSRGVCSERCVPTFQVETRPHETMPSFTPLTVLRSICSSHNLSVYREPHLE